MEKYDPKIAAALERLKEKNQKLQEKLAAMTEEERAAWERWMVLEGEETKD